MKSKRIFFFFNVTLTCRRISHVPLGAGNTAVSAWCAGAVRLHHGGIPVNCRNTRLLPPAIVRKMPTRLAVNLSLHNKKEVTSSVVFSVLPTCQQ